MSRSSWMMAALAFLLVACGENRSPSALDPIFPETDPTGFMQDLTDEVGRPLTLLEAIIQQGVPEKVATIGLEKFDEFRSKVKNDKHLTMIDFTQHSGQRRMYVIDRVSGKVDAIFTAHGEGSDPDGDGYAQYFSNIPNSRMSSLGAYLVQERYVGKWGPSMRLDGLEGSNNLARKRAIVLHPATYVRDGQSKQGLSWGCPAVPFDWIDQLITRLRDGSFMYAYGENTYKETSADLFIQKLALLPGFIWTDESEAAPADGGLR